MYKNSFIDNPAVIFSLLAFVSIINIFLPVHFLSLLLIGVIYTLFAKLLKEGNYALFTLMIIAFSFIELSQGLKLFSLSLLAFFIHIFISPLFNKILTSQKLVRVMIIFIFYLGTALLFSFLGEVTYELVAILLVNYLIDIAIVSLLP
jgi:hypothetical protein